jgi:hypothetical protein
MALTLDGIVVRHTSRPLESLYERSPILFAGFVFLVTLSWVWITALMSAPFWLIGIGTPLVLLIAALTPSWLELRDYAIEGDRRIIIDERGLQVEGILIPWSELKFHRHDDAESSVSLWQLGPETIIATFEHQEHRFSAFLGLRFRPLAPIAVTETLTKTLSEKETLALEALISEHLAGSSTTPQALRKAMIPDELFANR